MGKDYGDLGLNNFLAPTESPVNFGGATSGFEFESNNSRGAAVTSFLKDKSVTNDKVDSITADKISAGTIDSGIIYSGTIEADQIAAGILNSGVINSGTLNASNITGGTVTANILTAGTIDADTVRLKDLSASEINTGTMTANFITGGTLNGGTVTMKDLDASNITAGTMTGRTVRTASSGQRVVMDGSNNRIDFYNSGGTVVGRVNGTSGGIFFDNPDTSTSMTLGFGTVILGGAVAMTGNPMFLDGGDLTGAKSVYFQHNSSTPADRQFLMEDDGSNQRMRVHFANNGTQWQFDLTSVCQPVLYSQIDTNYITKYDLDTTLDDTRFASRYPYTEDIQEEYRAKPVSHYPSMGNDGTEQQIHNEAMWKRPWLPMKTMPDRLETMGQFPYPFVESPLIGNGEAKENFYQLIAHAYNHQQDRIDDLERRIGVLEGQRIGGDTI